MKDFFKRCFASLVLSCVLMLTGEVVNEARAGNAFIFVPTNDSALYTDPANWLNGNYPGSNIADGDSILFKTGNGFSSAFINTGITVLGHCGVGSGVSLYVNSGFELGGLNIFPSFGTDLKTETGSTFILNAGLTSYARNGVFNGDVIINGSFQARTIDGNDQSGSCELHFNAQLIIKGDLYFKLSHLNCHRVTVDSTGFIGGSISYEFWTSSLHIDSLLNYGTVQLREVYFTCTVLQNDSIFSTYTISADSVVNNAQFTISDHSPVEVSNKESHIRRLINEGDFDIFYIKLFLDHPFLNAQDFAIYEGSLMVAEMVNDGSFSAHDVPTIEWSSAINNGTFVWTAIDANTENVLQSNFVNNGIFTNHGKLRISGGSFENAGTVNIIPL